MKINNNIDNLEDKIRIVEAMPADAKDIIEYCKIIGSETDNLMYGEEGIHQTVESEAKVLKEHMESDNRIFLVAKEGDRIVGTANYIGFTKERIRHRGELGITVLKSMWGRHIGTRLMEQIIEFAKKSAKSEIISLEVRSDNERAIALYKKFGFKKIGEFKGFFKINGENIDFDLMNLYLNK